jgi:hypothetical protein
MNTDRRPWLQGFLAIGQMLLLAILPKCPLCIAAALSACGLSAGIASALAPWLRPLALPLLAASLLLLTRSLRGRRSCCAGHGRTA